nr:hypothetical protein [Tanacetum cinerariifolium]
MSTLKFADTHNMVAFLSKPTKSDGFEEIVDFMNANPIKYALTVNPTIYVSCIEQSWYTIVAKNINGKAQIHAKVDGKKLIIFEASIIRDLQFTDEEGVDCLPNSTIFGQLASMGLQAKEQQELTDEEKATLFMQLLEKRRMFFAAKRAEDKWNKPPTQAQQRKIMYTYLKNVEGKKLKDLKNKSLTLFRRCLTELSKGQMLKRCDREDLEDLYKLVKARYGSTRLVEDLNLLLCGDLKTMFEPHVEDEVWKRQQ